MGCRVALCVVLLVAITAVIAVIYLTVAPAKSTSPTPSSLSTDASGTRAFTTSFPPYDGRVDVDEVAYGLIQWPLPKVRRDVIYKLTGTLSNIYQARMKSLNFNSTHLQQHWAEQMSFNYAMCQSLKLHHVQFRQRHSHRAKREDVVLIDEAEEIRDFLGLDHFPAVCQRKNFLDDWLNEKKCIRKLLALASKATNDNLAETRRQAAENQYLTTTQQLDFDLRVHLLGQQDTNLMVLQSARSGKLQDWLMFLSPTYPGDLGDIIRESIPDRAVRPLFLPFFLDSATVGVENCVLNNTASFTSLEISFRIEGPIFHNATVGIVYEERVENSDCVIMWSGSSGNGKWLSSDRSRSRIYSSLLVTRWNSANDVEAALRAPRCYDGPHSAVNSLVVHRRMNDSGLDFILLTNSSYPSSIDYDETERRRVALGQDQRSNSSKAVLVETVGNTEDSWGWWYAIPKPIRAGIMALVGVMIFMLLAKVALWVFEWTYKDVIYVLRVRCCCVR